MRPVFKYKCSKEDYKTWTPLDGISGRRCLMGRQETFERRVPHSNCYNGLEYDSPRVVRSCPCAREDFECDFGYGVNQITKKCDLLGDPIASTDFFTCQEGQFFNKTQGYRRIPGNVCQGGEFHAYDPVITPCPMK